MPPMSEPTKEELLARIAELEKRADAKKSGKLEFKGGEKGGVSVYGLGRFPGTLYYEQWLRLLDVAGGLRALLEGNKRCPLRPAAFLRSRTSFRLSSRIFIAATYIPQIMRYPVWPRVPIARWLDP